MTPPLFRVSAGCAALIGGALVASVAQAEADAVILGCPGVSAPEIARILNLELSTVHRAPAGPHPRVEILCRREGLRIEISRLPGGGRLSRELPIPQASLHGSERELALAASELIVVSGELERWRRAEALADAAVPPSMPAPSPQPAATRHDRQWLELGLAVGVRTRAKNRSPRLLRTALRAGIRLSERFALWLEPAVEFGQQSRQVGTVDMRIVDVGLGIGGRIVRSSWMIVDATLGAAAGYVRLEGEPSIASYGGSAVSGMQGSVGVGLEPTFVLGPARLGVALQAGWAMATTRGVIVGDDPSSVAGLYLGASVVLGVGLP